jgi:transcriptional regulator with XRE-family HTH domain
MSLPDFSTAGKLSVPELRLRMSDRVRLERRRLKLSQSKFAEQCQIPLRTYKRFEQGRCDSLEVFLRIVTAFERTVALELLFPPKGVTAIEVRSPAAALGRLMTRAQKRSSP